jgi:hypothetical protein
MTVTEGTIITMVRGEMKSRGQETTITKETDRLRAVKEIEIKEIRKSTLMKESSDDQCIGDKYI